MFSIANRRRVLLLLVVTGYSAGGALAFEPPVDRAGPLTARIEGPDEVTEIDTRLPVQIVLDNDGDEAITGTLRLAVIDQWQCEPAAAVPFTVAAAGTATYDFHVRAGRGTYSAYYPVHAFATFSFQGKKQTAHPILITRTHVTPVAQPPEPLVWRPLELSANRALALWNWPVRRAVIAVFNRAPRAMPVGWTGTAPGSRAAVDVQAVELAGNRRLALAVHPPWDRGQIGTVFVEYPLALPDATPIQLDFATAVTPTGHGDGVTFRVRVATLDAPVGTPGTVLFERHSAAKQWQPARVDLGRYAGQQIRLQFESHPGPRHDVGWDLSYWAEPLLRIGTPPDPPAFPPASLQGAHCLGTIRGSGTGYEVHVCPGRRGLLDADVTLVAGPRQLCFRGFQVRVLGDRLDDRASPTTVVGIVTEPDKNGYRVRHYFNGPRGSFELVGHLLIEDGALRARFQLKNAPAPRPWFAPRIEQLAVGPWSALPTRIYAGHGNVLEHPKAFRLPFDGHRLATSYVGFDFPGGISLLQAVDSPPDALDVDPASRHYSLHAAHNATFTWIPADNVWEAVKVYRDICGPPRIGSQQGCPRGPCEPQTDAVEPKTLRAAAGVGRLAGRFVFDLWGGHYRETGEQLERAFRYGLTDAVVVWHNWQRWGYDYRLPEIDPPNPRWGTAEELRVMIAACRRTGVLFALHDNYIDMYPDAAGFSYEQNIAFHDAATPVRGWLNRGRQAQAYRYRADRVEPFLRPNLLAIHERLRPTAYFIDVWASIQPYDYWTADGTYFDRRLCCDVWGSQFAWIRRLLGNQAPQISESGHDQLIGQLDGAQANHLRVGPKLAGDYSWSVWDICCDDAERVPWFDAAHHHRFVLHGAGYSNRYQAGLDPRLHGIASDDYLATEVLTGHPAMVARPFGRDVVRAYWLTHDLMRALALRTIEAVRFVDGDIHRQYIEWSGGGQVWVNRGREDWVVRGHTLPEYGFLARVRVPDGVVTASISRRDGVIVETARAPRHWYVNGRRQPRATGKPGDGAPDPYIARHNPDGRPVDFGPVVTAGGCRLARDGNGLRITPLPGDDANGTIIHVHWDRLPWTLPRPTQVETIAEDGRVRSRKPLGAKLRLECHAGDFAFRLSRGGANERPDEDTARPR